MSLLTQELPEIIDVETTAELVQNRQPIKLIDVRTPAEFETAHIPGSYNVPLDQLPEHRAELQDALRAPAVLVCRSGARAQQAARLLQEADLTNVHIMEGGIVAWEAHNKPLKRGRQRWGMERQVRFAAGSVVLAGLLGSLAWRPLALISAFIGAGLTYSALSDSCGMAFLLAKLPHNRAATCDVRDVVRQMVTEQPSA